MYVNTRGVVIKETKVGDNDKILTVFSEDLGKIRISARGARRQGNRLSAVRLLCYASFTLFKSSKGYSLNEFELLNSFPAVSGSIESLSLASYFSEIMCAVTQEKIADKRLLSLFLNSLYIISENIIPLPQVKAVFELKCACLMGYEPQVSECVICGCDAESFSCSDGGTVCKKCRPSLSVIDKSTISVLGFICHSPDKKVFLFKVSDKILCEISSICEEYLLSCVEFIPNSLEMYKKLVTI